MTILSTAILIATTAHDGQFDKAGKPYILHPLKVMHKLHTDDEELQAIAVLHDVIEDTSVTYEDLMKQGITERVIKGVMALTKQRGETYEQYKKRVMTNRDAMLVKLEDLRHNSDLSRLKGISDKDIARAAKYQTFYFQIQQELNKK